MKVKYFNLIMLLLSGCVFLWSCSRIEIQNPVKDEVNITTPYTAVVHHTGCGTAKPETFKAWLDKDGDAPLEITDAFSFTRETWTAQSYPFPMGSHTLTAKADVATATGPSCFKDKSLARRTFFVAPCTDFTQAYGKDFQLVPDTLTITYGSTVVTLHPGDTKVLRIPENSPYLIDGKLSATLGYSLRNITAKHMKIEVGLQYGVPVIYKNFLAFCGPDIVTEQHNVLFADSSSPLPLKLVSYIDESSADDVMAEFFRAELRVVLLPVGGQ